MKKTLLLAGALLGSMIFSNAQWVQSNGPEGKSITNIVNHNGTILIKSAMKSTNNGDSWQTASLTGIPSDYAEGATFYNVDGQLFAYEGTKLYKSADNGDTWTSSDSGLELNANSAPFLFDDDSTLYAASSNKGVFKSTDGGSNWSKFGINTLSIDDYIFPRVICAIDNNIIVGTTKKIFVSENDDDAFVEKQSFDFGANSIDVAVIGEKVYLASDNSKLYVSGDKGMTWTENDLGIEMNGLTKNSSGELFASTNSGIYKIENNGTTSTQILDNGFENLKVKQLAIYNNKYFAATNMGVCRSTGANDWGLANSGLGYANVWGFDNTDSVYYMATSSGVWRSKSYGQRWIPVGLFGKVIKSILAYNNKVYAVENTSNPSSLIVYVSEDEGKTWTQVGSAIEDATIPTLATAGGHLYCHAEQGSNDGVYKLTNFQGDWSNVEASGGVAFEVIGNKIYNGLKVGDENGANWSSLTGNISNVSPYSFTGTSDGTTIYAGAYILSSGKPYAFKSTDGTDFSTFQTGMNSNTSTVFGMITRGDTIYAVATENMEKTRSYYTTDGASGWTEFGGSLLNSIYTGDRSSLILAPYSMLLGSNNGKGVFRYDFEQLPEVPDTVDQIEYPPLTNQANHNVNHESITIYPNPASEYININAETPVRKMVLINMQGQIIKELYPGKSTIIMNISDVTSGIYLLKIWNDKKIPIIHTIIIND